MSVRIENTLRGGGSLGEAPAERVLPHRAVSGERANGAGSSSEALRGDAPDSASGAVPASRPHGFTEAQLAYLRSLPVVDEVVDDAIHYTLAFRRECMKRYARGESPTAIFRSVGLDPALIGRKRIERAITRWRKSQDDGSPGQSQACRELRRENKRLKSEVAALRAMVRLLSARQESKVRKSNLFELIERLRQADDDFSARAACNALGVSLSGYYSWREREGLS